MLLWGTEKRTAIFWREMELVGSGKIATNLSLFRRDAAWGMESCNELPAPKKISHVGVSLVEKVRHLKIKFDTK